MLGLAGPLPVPRGPAGSWTPANEGVGRRGGRASHVESPGADCVGRERRGDVCGGAGRALLHRQAGPGGPVSVTIMSLFDDPPAEDTDTQHPVQPAPEHSADTLLTPAEAAAVLKIGRSTLYELIARGGIESVKLGRCRRFRRSDLDRFIRTLAA